ncbi:uncharacterized protein NEMAJ01_1346 [Nematocida major]|uniref:uncharacterized protein n=1 Tax=Nematocida major TaxID=1912982 RepID=UPI0020078135|nr:uncharacterized protein NEMAJ01_1346 [Nematocida major]KAH9386450.1 hypothetical protein NEMAJ01_1346 [Nematocida major]
MKIKHRSKITTDIITIVLSARKATRAIKKFIWSRLKLDMCITDAHEYDLLSYVFGKCTKFKFVENSVPRNRMVLVEEMVRANMLHSLQHSPNRNIVSFRNAVLAQAKDRSRGVPICEETQAQQEEVIRRNLQEMETGGKETVKGRLSRHIQTILYKLSTIGNICSPHADKYINIMHMHMREHDAHMRLKNSAYLKARLEKVCKRHEKKNGVGAWDETMYSLSQLYLTVFGERDAILDTIFDAIGSRKELRVKQTDAFRMTQCLGLKWYIPIIRSVNYHRNRIVQETDFYFQMMKGVHGMPILWTPGAKAPEGHIAQAKSSPDGIQAFKATVSQALLSALFESLNQPAKAECVQIPSEDLDCSGEKASESASVAETPAEIPPEDPNILKLLSSLDVSQRMYVFEKAHRYARALRVELVTPRALSSAHRLVQSAWVYVFLLSTLIVAFAASIALLVCRDIFL